MKSRTSFILGLGLLCWGIWLLLSQMRFFSHVQEQIYPFLILLLSGFLLLYGIRNRSFGMLFWAVFIFQLGLFYFLRNFNLIPYFSLDEYWPIFLFALGNGFLTLFVVFPYRWGLALLAGIFLYLGLWFGIQALDFIPTVLDFIFTHFVPLFLILIGIILLAHSETIRRFFGI